MLIVLIFVNQGKTTQKLTMPAKCLQPLIVVGGYNF